MKRKLLVAMLIGTMLLSACAGGSTPPASSGGDPAESAAEGAESTETPESTAEPAPGDTVITYACWDRSQLPVYEELFRQFEAENPGVTVVPQLTAWGEYWTKLEAGVTGNNAPDVFLLNIPRSYDFVSEDVIIPLDDLNIEFDKFPQQHLGAYTWDGKLYGVPKDFDTMGLWYNKKLFDQAGVAYPSDDWTWDDLKENAKALTDEANGIYGIAAALAWQGGYYDTVYQNGGYTFSEDGKKSGFDDPKTIAGVEYYYSLTAEGVSPPLDVIANTPGRDMFDSGKVAMLVSGSYVAPVFFQESDNKDDIDVAMVPSGPAGKACTSNALAHVIYSGSQVQDMAKKLIEFLSTKEAHEHVAASGVVIPAYEGSQAAWVNAFPEKNAQALINMVEFAVPLPNVPNSSAAMGIENDIFAQAWAGSITIEEACLQVAQKADEILNQ